MECALCARGCLGAAAGSAPCGVRASATQYPRLQRHASTHFRSLCSLYKHQLLSSCKVVQVGHLGARHAIRREWGRTAGAQTSPARSSASPQLALAPLS